jgi:hypothetical protein
MRGCNFLSSENNGCAINASPIQFGAITNALRIYLNSNLENDAAWTLLSTAQPHADRSHPAIALWHARGLIGNDNAAALRACNEAFTGYDADHDVAGSALATALALFVLFATIENVGEISVWVERYERGPFDDERSRPLDEQAIAAVMGHVSLPPRRQDDVVLSIEASERQRAG